MNIAGQTKREKLAREWIVFQLQQVWWETERTMQLQDILKTFQVYVAWLIHSFSGRSNAHSDAGCLTENAKLSNDLYPAKGLILRPIVLTQTDTRRTTLGNPLPELFMSPERTSI